MRLDWRHGILYAATMGMEGCWLYALLALLNQQVAGGRLSVLGLLLLYSLAFGFNRLLQRLRWDKKRLYLINGLALIAGMLSMVKIQLYGSLGLSDPAWLLALPRAVAGVIYGLEPEVLMLGGGVVLWWLGWRLARLRVNFASSLTEFQFGLAILLIVSLSAYQFGAQPANTAQPILIFFFFALMGVALARAREGTGWLAGLHRGPWFMLLLVSIGVVFVLGLLVSSVVTADLLQLAVIALKWIWGLILKAITFLVSLFPEPAPAELPPDIPMPTIPPEAETFTGWTLPEVIWSVLRFGWYVLVIGFVLFTLWQVSSHFLAWFRRVLATTAGAEVEPLPGAFRADVLGLLRRIALRLLRVRIPFRLRGRSETVSPEAASVRQIYRQLLRWAAAAGWPRAQSQTPYEYLHTLEGLLPVAREDLRFITQHYVSVRYGTSSSGEEELRGLRQSWHQVRQNRLKGPSSEPAHDQEAAS